MTEIAFKEKRRGIERGAYLLILKSAENGIDLELALGKTGSIDILT